jgi:aspartyl/asparaginyl beta-hydroxylase (cupin superfamily)
MADTPSAATPRELNEAAIRAMSAGDFAQAQALLKRALLGGSDNLAVWLNLAGACRALQDYAGAMEAVDGALRVNPRAFRALLMKGSLYERQNDRRRTANLYGAALAVVPRGEALDAATSQALAHAREVHARYLDELADFIRSDIAPLRELGSSAEARRINAFVELTLGRRQNFRQEPMEFFYPGLPAIEFWDRAEFPWLAAVEAGTAAIRAELLAILRDDFRDFVPYVAYPDGLPIDQWKELNHSRRWGALHLWELGQQVEKNAGRCPETMRLTALAPQPRVPSRSPASMFSALQPKTRIPPHTGVANTRLVVHLPLVVPEGCGFRVGNETRQWREGEGWVFDDTIVHEAWNESEQPRVILIFDVWNPRLSPAEREMIAGVMSAMDKFNGVKPQDSL